MSRKDKCKIICNHLFHDQLVDRINETYLIMSVWDGLKEIDELEAEMLSQELIRIKKRKIELKKQLKKQRREINGF